jgi:hypothetical protein
MGVLGVLWGTRGTVGVLGGYRGCAGSSTGFLAARACASMCVFVCVQCACACNARVRAMRVCVRACAHLCVYVHLCACALRACARVCAYVRASVSACACVRAFPSDCIFARGCVANARVRLGAVRALPSHGARGCGRCHRPGSRASAAGVTWTNRTTKAEWEARWGHTSVVDAAGAIYVIGGDGYGNGTYFQDVWASTDGGARPDSVQGGDRGVLEVGYSAVL